MLAALSSGRTIVSIKGEYTAILLLRGARCPRVLSVVLQRSEVSRLQGLLVLCIEDNPRLLRNVSGPLSEGVDEGV